MKISPQWLREFVDLQAGLKSADLKSDANRRLADDLTLAGIAVESIQQQDGQTLFEMEITTNRPDAMNHHGVARECSAIYDVDLRPVAPRLPPPRPAAQPFPIDIQDAQGCGRYTARVVRGVKIAPSPARLLERLKIDGHHGIYNAVDASNYALMEMGHPTHAFDLDRLEGGRIVVRRARAGETVTTLDGVERKLQPEDLVIADAARPVALAGIMGGLHSAISATTINILIESAWFDPATVRRTARRLGMHTDASHIFERGADWGATLLACNRVAELVLETAGGELEGEAVDAIGRSMVRPSLRLRRGELLRHLGQDISGVEVMRILRRLGFTPAAETGESGETETWTVELPTWRLDVEREIDLVEEIARLHGYDKFPSTLPAFSGGVVELPHAPTEARLRSQLLALGYNEAISSTFMAPAEASAFAGPGPESVPVLLENPLSEEQSAMRTSLVPGMLAMLGWNLNRGTANVRLFEMGNVFRLAGEKSEEQKTICVGATGNAADPGLHGAARPWSFFDLKGIVEILLGAFDIRDLRFQESAAGYYYPGRCARALAGDQVVALFGQLHPGLAAARKLRQEIYLAEIDLGRLLQLPLRAPRYQPLSRYPAVDRDFSFLLEDRLIFERIHSTVRALEIAGLQSFTPVEIFRGGSVPQGQYSVLLRARFQSTEGTLRDDEIAQWSARIIQALEALGGILRSGFGKDFGKNFGL